MFYLSDLLLHVIGFGWLLAAPVSYDWGVFFVGNAYPTLCSCPFIRPDRGEGAWRIVFPV